MNFARTFVLCAALAAMLLLTGCLAAQYKIYRCKLNADGTGSGTITFVNLHSQDDDSSDASASDFKDLVSDYLNGSKYEDENPRIHVTGKRLYEEKGVLMGEVTYTFDHADSAGFILNSGCPIIFVPGNTETILESNGKILTAATPAISWPGGTTELWYKTSTDADTTKMRSMVELYRNWKKTVKSE
jgi:hypothetical protein